MRPLLAPALLVALGSCQFNGADHEIELLPESEESGRGPASQQPAAEFGAASGSIEQALALRLAEQAAATRAAEAEAERLRLLAVEASAARASAEQELLTAEAALAHERAQRDALEKEREFLLSQIRETQAALHGLEGRAEERAALEKRLAELELELYEAKVYRPSAEGLALDDALRAVEAALQVDGAPRHVAYFDAAGQTGLRLDGQVLFGSGQTALSAEGLALLEGLAADLEPLVAAGARLQIIGHTDSQPLQAQAARFPLGNLQLSCERALMVADALREAGLPQQALSIAGMGALLPLDEADTPDARARNRRVEVLVVPPSGSDQKPEGQDAAPLAAEHEPGLR